MANYAKFVLTFSLLGLLSFATPASAAKCSFRAIFNFGDSNSDTGGFFAAFPAQHLPFGTTYFKKPAGRASDGRAAIDFLAQALGLPFLSPYLQSIGSNYKHGANFATSSSTVLLPKTSLFVKGVSPFSLAIQLNQMKELRDRVLEMGHKGGQLVHISFFQQTHKSYATNFLYPFDSVWSTSNLPPRNIFSQSLYTIDIGQNDFGGNVGVLGIKGIKRYVPQVASQIAWTIKELYDIGGRVFFVMNLAPIGCFPACLTELPHKTSDLDSYGCMIPYNSAVVYYNKLLKKNLRQTHNQLKDASVIYVDTHSVKLELFQHPRNHGFLYGTKACCGVGGGAYNFDPRVFCGSSKVINGRNITAKACNDPQKYVSWDGIHATEAANKLIVKAILNGSYFDPPFPLSELCNLRPVN